MAVCRSIASGLRPASQLSDAIGEDAPPPQTEIGRVAYTDTAGAGCTNRKWLSQRDTRVGSRMGERLTTLSATAVMIG